MFGKRLSFVCCIILFFTLVVSCSQEPQLTPEEQDRAALFDYIIEKTRDREAWSPVKNQNLNYDPIEEMKKYRDEMIKADTDEKLFYTLVKLSNARRDRHLSIDTIEGGLNINAYDNVQIPVKFAVDFGTPDNYFLFISDLAANVSEYSAGNGLEIGDKLIEVNGQSFQDYFRSTIPFYRYSTKNGLWWKVAEGLSGKSINIPPEFYGAKFIGTFEKVSGAQYTVSLPYLSAEDISWQGYWKNHGDFRYPGFEKLAETQTYDLYKALDGKRVLLLDWYGFREDLVDDMDNLVAFAAENSLLDYDIIVDATRSRGGSKGAYAIQKLTSKSFKTTFGNLKISDITEKFIQGKVDEYNEDRVEDSGVKETIDDGGWLVDWLKTDVTEAIRAGKEYSNNVPFKLAHLPRDSDGILPPAETHFKGKLVCFFGPSGGSHLDQFAAMVTENKLAYTIGMPCGGYSNTWEWSENLVFPNSGKPVVEFMWNIGHTITPNGKILEGNPSPVDDYVPLTRDNYLNYYQIMIDKALIHLGQK